MSALVRASLAISRVSRSMMFDRRPIEVGDGLKTKPGDRRDDESFDKKQFPVRDVDIGLGGVHASASPLVRSQ